MPKLTVGTCCPPITEKESAYNARYALALFPALDAFPDGAIVIGGGHSVAERLDEICAYRDGPLLCSGSAIDYILPRRPDATLYCIDGDPAMIEQVRGRRIKSAILAAHTDPSALNYLDIHGCRVRVFNHRLEGIAGNHATTSISVIPALALHFDYFKPIRFYGCDSSWKDGRSHIHKHELAGSGAWDLVVRCNGAEYETSAEFLLQAEFLCEVMNAAPHLYVNRSAGLLSAMIAAHGEYDVIEAGDKFTVSESG